LLQFTSLSETMHQNNYSQKETLDSRIEGTIGSNLNQWGIVPIGTTGQN